MAGSNQTIYIWYLLHMTLRDMSKDHLARNRDNVPEWSDMYTHRLMFQ